MNKRKVVLHISKYNKKKFYMTFFMPIKIRILSRKKITAY